MSAVVKKSDQVHTLGKIFWYLEGTGERILSVCSWRKVQEKAKSLFSNLYPDESPEIFKGSTGWL